ncbi:protein rep, partial [Escherichia coli]|uniref:protein rep n=1 Tax=Escherichia coli TaxID=562 RepID=UPI003242D9A8
MVLWVPSSWFTRDYVKHERWVEIWSECLRVDYAAGAHIKRVRGPTNTHPVPFLLPVFWIFSGVVTEHFGNVTANHFAVFAN